jgi:hypothetical protein
MFAIMIDDEWYPIIGDPSLMGWFTVAAYFVAALLCWRASVTAKRTRPPGVIPASALFWFALVVFLIFLGTNKQLDLQTWLTALAKQLSKAQGWYENRRIVQIIFIALVALAGILFFAGLVWLTRARWKSHWLALAGSMFLACFIVVRAASFHHIDQWLGWRIGGLKVNWILELGGIGCIAFSAWKNSRKSSLEKKRSHEIFATTAVRR